MLNTSIELVYSIKVILYSTKEEKTIYIALIEEFREL